MIIRAKQDGFRRCGVAFSKTATQYPAAAFTPAQLEILKNEPLLVVEIAADEGKTTLKAADIIAAIQTAASLEALVEIVGTDQRKTVLDAAAKKKTELEAPQE